jgi:hypothetical protein
LSERHVLRLGCRLSLAKFDQALNGDPLLDLETIVARTALQRTASLQRQEWQGQGYVERSGKKEA